MHSVQMIRRYAHTWHKRSQNSHFLLKQTTTKSHLHLKPSLSLSLSQSQGRNFNEKISKNGKEREKAGRNHINNRRGLSFSNFWYVFLHRLFTFLFSFIVIFIIYSLLCFWEEKKNIKKLNLIVHTKIWTLWCKTLSFFGFLTWY